MSLCKLEFFDHNFTFKHHAIADIEEIDDDYLAPEKTEVLIDLTDNVAANQFVWITGEFEYFGMVTEVSVEDDQTKVSFEPFVSLFNGDVLVPIGFEANSLEEMISQCIYVFWAKPDPFTSSNAFTTPRGIDTEWDIKMSIRLRTVLTTSIHTSSILPSLPDFVSDGSYLRCGAFRAVAGSSNYNRCSSTINYTMELDTDEFAQSRMKVNLLDDILPKAMKYYGIVVQARPDFASSCIDVLVSTPSGYNLKAFDETGDSDYNAATATMPIIMADDQTVTVEYFTLDSASADANTLVIYSTGSNTLSATYYLHNDGRSPAYDMSTSSRVLPPKRALAYADGTGSTFTNTNAPKAAKEYFKDMIWNSSIQLKFTKNDPLFKPEKIKIGQLCKIWHDGKCYISMLTARKLGDETVLTFGSVRTTLTKQMKLEKKKKK